MEEKKERNKNNAFESRILTEPFDIVAVVNHLEDNLDEKPLIVTLTTKSQTDEEKKDPEIIEVKSEEQIPEINKILMTKMVSRNTRISIE